MKRRRMRAPDDGSLFDGPLDTESGGYGCDGPPEGLDGYLKKTRTPLSLQALDFDPYDVPFDRGPSANPARL